MSVVILRGEEFDATRADPPAPAMTGEPPRWWEASPTETLIGFTGRDLPWSAPA